jgi:hypothetical protein
MPDYDQDEQPDDHDELTIADLFTHDELNEMDRADEYRLDAEDEARNAREAAEAEAAQQPYDTAPWLGYADGEER